MDPKFTIISVVYNAVDDVRRTISSVIHQEYQNYEYIVVDGGSTDGTLKVLQEYSSSGALRYISEPDNGIYDAINKGVALASGEFINVIMMGDHHDSTFLDKNKDHLQSYDFSYSGCKCIKLSGDIKLNYCRPIRSIRDVTGMPFAHNTLVVKRDICLKFPYSVGYKYAADFDFVCTLFANNIRGVSIPECLSSYEVGGVGNSFESVYETFLIMKEFKLLSFRSIWVLFKQILVTAKVKYL
jgi:glycosyltransferase involved in cell wall biosynthesis